MKTKYKNIKTETKYKNTNTIQKYEDKIQNTQIKNTVLPGRHLPGFTPPSLALTFDNTIQYKNTKTKYKIEITQIQNTQIKVLYCIALHCIENIVHIVNVLQLQITQCSLCSAHVTCPTLHWLHLFGFSPQCTMCSAHVTYVTLVQCACHMCHTASCSSVKGCHT